MISEVTDLSTCSKLIRIDLKKTLIPSICNSLLQIRFQRMQCEFLNILPIYLCPEVRYMYVSTLCPCFMTQRRDRVLHTQKNVGPLNQKSELVGQDFSEFEQAQFLATLQDLFTLLNDLPLPSDYLLLLKILFSITTEYFTYVKNCTDKKY